jgi:glutathione S-transferase
MRFTIHGPTISTYVRSVRMAFLEKGAEYTLSEVNIVAGENKQSAHLGRHPFGKVPALCHDGFTLYETDPILRYLDRVLPGPALTPADAKLAARMDMIIAIVDAYAYPSMITAVVMNRLVAPMLGGTADEAVIAGAMPQATLALAEIARLHKDGGGAFLAGDAVSMADLMLAPVLSYFSQTPEGGGALATHAGLGAWWSSFARRPHMQATQPKFG